MSDLKHLKSIDLAHEPAFTLGPVTVAPALRQLRRADIGIEEIVEPRIMQVLVALARASGGIVTRDELTALCWDGRIVGEDAINRAISRVRRLGEGIGAGAFHVETVTKVGYRLVVETPGAADHPVEATPPLPLPDPTPAPPVLRSPRRALLAGALGVGAAAAAGSWWWRRSTEPAEPSVEVQTLMREGIAAHQSLTQEGVSQGMAFFRRVTDIAPDYPDGWGALALTYAIQSKNTSPDEAEPYVARARAAIEKAEALEPGNGYAKGARAWLLPKLGRWLELESGLRAAVAQHPDQEYLASALAQMLASVGRMREAAAVRDPVVKAERPTPILLWPYMVDLWAANRLEEADRVAEQAHELFPLNFAVWFGRFYLFLYTGRARQAIAMADDVRGRPANIAAEEIAYVREVAQAFLNRTPAAIGPVLTQAAALARQGAGHCENAIQFAAALGDRDLAFSLTDAYFFARGFAVPSLRFPKGPPVFTRPDDRRSAILFLPSTATMRTDPRFDTLVRELGLERYWSRSGAQPDFRR